MDFLGYPSNLKKISNFFLSIAPWHRWRGGDRQRVVCGPHAVRQEGSALRPQKQEGETQVVHGRRQGMPTSTNLFLVCKTGFFSPIFEHHEQMDMTDP